MKIKDIIRKMMRHNYLHKYLHMYLKEGSFRKDFNAFLNKKLVLCRDDASWSKSKYLI